MAILYYWNWRCNISIVPNLIIKAYHLPNQILYIRQYKSQFPNIGYYIVINWRPFIRHYIWIGESFNIWNWKGNFQITIWPIDELFNINYVVFNHIVEFQSQIFCIPFFYCPKNVSTKFNCLYLHKKSIFQAHTDLMKYLMGPNNHDIHSPILNIQNST